MAPYLRSQARSAAFGPSVAALRPASGERVQALQAVFEEAVPARKTSSKSNRSAQQHTSASAEAHEGGLINVDSRIVSSSNSTNMVGEHTLDHPKEMYGQILVDMSKVNEDNTEAASKCYNDKIQDSAAVPCSHFPRTCHPRTNHLALDS